jgi:hypothetical protein
LLGAGVGVVFFRVTTLLQLDRRGDGLGAGGDDGRRRGRYNQAPEARFEGSSFCRQRTGPTAAGLCTC